jgi:hypothetical protein
VQAEANYTGVHLRISFEKLYCYQIASAYLPKDALCLIQSPRNDEVSEERRLFQIHRDFVIARPAHKVDRL